MRNMVKDVWSLGKRPKVCVVGAGFSGLVCAERLGRQGMDVTVLEARDRVGGRVHQLNSLGHWTDMGANWIHGARGNPIYKLAVEVGAVTIDMEEQTVIYSEDGKELPESYASRVEATLWSTIAEAFQYCSTQKDIPVTKSLKDFVTEKVQLEDLSEDEKKTVLQMANLWGGYIGSPYERQSLKYLFLEESLEDGNAFIASTYKDILNLVTRQAQEQATIKLGVKVTSIESNASGKTSVSISYSSAVNGVEGDGSSSSQTFDAIVVTIPFGCLRDKQISISPSFPANVSHAVESITYGNLEKVYIKFPKAFWRTSSDTQPFFRMFLHPKYASENPEHWEVSSLSLASLPDAEDELNHPTLLFYVYGPCGTHVTNLITKLSPNDPLYLSRLIAFFEPYYSRLPNFSGDNPDCRPLAALATDWQHDALAGYGSYTNWQIDDNAKLGKPPKMPLDKAIETLREGLPEQGLWFAGEHTAPFNALGTVTGAYLSGEEVARKVTKHFKRAEGGKDETAKI